MYILTDELLEWRWYSADFLFTGIKKNSTNPIYFPCAYNIEILSFYFSYGYLCDDYNGYAHLLEHMIIKIRQKYFDKVYENGILFNAVTKEYTTEYTFINSNFALE